MKLPSPFTGIVPPVVTPMTDRDTLDVAGLERLLEHIIAGGAHGLFMLGTTGEGPSLSYRLREEVICESCRIVKDRVPVLVGITDTAFVESVKLARVAADSGVSAVVAAPPYYLPEGQPELLDYLEDLLPEMPLPFFLYNMPSLTKVSFEVDTILKDRPDWSIFMGPEELLLDAVMAGGQGGVNGGANLFPQLYVALYDAAARGDIVRAKTLHDVVLEVSSQLYHVGRHPSAIIKGLKCALSVEGVCDDFMAEPFRRFQPEGRRRIEEVLIDLKERVSAAV